MNNNHVSMNRVVSYRAKPANTADRSNAIQEHFDELVQILERLKDSRQTNSCDGTLERWEDAESIYLQTDLQSVLDLEVDINVHDGRCYIRLQR